MDDNPIGALLALVLQATVVGWIPAMLWAWDIVHRENPVPNPVETPAPQSTPESKKDVK